ncbi:MAG: alpha-xylosidase [Candidatus Abyssubacteria bacterium]
MFQPDSTPIFAHTDRFHHYLLRCVGAREEAGSVVFDGILENGEPLAFTVTPVTPQIIRIRYHATGLTIAHETPFIAAPALPPVRTRLSEDKESYVLKAGVTTVRVQKSPWQMSVSSGGKTVFRQEIMDRAFTLPVTYPVGYSESADGAVRAHETFSLEPDECLFGLGPKYMSVNKRGERAVMWCEDTHGTTTTELSYISIPFFMSSRGYGFFLNCGEKSIFELGSYSTVSGSVSAESPLMDYYLILGTTPAEILKGYTLLTGRPAVPPKWAFGVWMSRCIYMERPTVEAVVNRMRSLGLPLDVVNVDPAWLKVWDTRRQPGCEFEWNTERYPDPEGFIRALGERHVRLCLWENPYVPDKNDFYEEAARKGYLVKKPDGSVAEPAHPMCADMGIFDYTNPDAVAWVKDIHKRLLRQGVAAFKTDYGESIPEDVIFHNGKTGREMHNVYPLLYNKAVFEAIEEERGEAVVFGRSGAPGSQRYPIQWAGDSQCSYAGMAGALKGGLSYAMSGGALWSHDIGGFINTIEPETPPTPALYIRWAQFGLLSPIARFHGMSPREPWEYGKAALEIVRKFSLLRMRLVPYLYSYAYEASRTGLPLMRPVHLEFPDDPHARCEELEYLLGRELLVAPVFNDAGDVTVYLPPGQWHDFWTGASHEGPKFLTLNVPLDSMPLYVRGDSILPLAREAQSVDEQSWDDFQVRVYLSRRAQFSLYDGKNAVSFEASVKGRSIRMNISSSEREYDILFHRIGDVKAVKCSGPVSKLKWKSGKKSTRVSLRADGAIGLTLTTS